MDKILNTIQAEHVVHKLQKEDKKIVVVGGCFDILHIGHIRFLNAAKQCGDVLMLLLESDERVSMLKGENRPIHKQKERAELLASISVIDYILPLPLFVSNSEYDKLIFKLKPAIIATTKSDPFRVHKERQAALVKGEVVDVIERIPNYATTQIEKSLK